ncbi:MAG: right-handed parallel beta-helix repeat-containing protein, partial [bacterium]|nr:right-handed parallel beta-helix repeat-containing protein [bacterium]
MHRRAVFVAGILVALAAMSAHGAVWYVDVDNTGTEDGTSWTTAFTTIQPAIDAASAGDEVWVAEGVYTGTLDPVVSVAKDISLFGSFAGSEADPSERALDTPSTTIDGETARRCIVVSGSVVIDGFLLTRGSPGLQADVTSLTLRNSTCTTNSYGGADITGGIVVIEDCLFEGNTTNGDGGGVRIGNVTSTLVRRCRFLSNDASGNGGGLQRQYGDITIENCLFSGNTADSGGGVYTTHGDAMSIVNCTFWQNTAAPAGGAVYASNTAPTIRNTIVWGSNGSLMLMDGFDITHSNLSEILPGEGNISEYPLLIPGVLKPSRGSPCIDAGASAGAPSDDIEGTSRPQGASVDIGAYEALTYPQNPPVVYVDQDNVSGTEDGTSWSTAYDTIQEAVDTSAAVGGGQVWIAEGTYTGSGDYVVVMEPGVELYGGFEGSETSIEQRDWTKHKAIIDGENACRGVQPTHKTVLDGIHIQHGYASDNGGAIWANTGDVTLRNCTIADNTASWNGGGVYVSHAASMVAQDCTFFQNTALGTSGAGNAGALWLQTSSDTSRFENCMFYGNESKRGGAVFSNPSWETYVNCVFYGNSAPTGASLSLSGEGTVTNCIIWGNSTNPQFNAGDAVTYSVVEGGRAAEGNLDTDPLFFDATNGDFRLRPPSPCIDAGTPLDAPGDDIDGNPRPVDVPGKGTEGPGAFDMGAYENPNVIHVDASMASTGGTCDGRTWSSAFPTIDEGIAQAVADGGGQIWVARGTYTSAGSAVAVLSASVDIFGGFAGVASELSGLDAYDRDVDANPTILDGEGVRRCVVGAEGGVLDGLTLINGAGDNGAGLLADGVAMVVRDCVVQDCHATVNGGGVCALNGADVMLDACRFLTNQADAQGGAIANSASTMSLVNCVASGNTAGSGGGGIANTLTSTLDVMNCVLYGNTVTSGTGGGVLNYATGTVTNSILWANAPDQAPGVITVTYSTVQGGLAGGNISADPLFWDAATHDFRLAQGSPCIDAATDTGAPDVDIDDTVRPIDVVDVGTTLTYDMGAYEMPGVVYVNVNTPCVEHLQTGRSWSLAFGAIQEGIDQAALDGGGEVWVAEGTYTATTDPVVTVKSGAELYGGFTGSESCRSQRDWNTHPTVIDGEDARRCIYADVDCVFDGLAVTRGSANSGACLYVDFANLIVRNCTFSDGVSPAGGAAIYSLADFDVQTTSRIEDSTFATNTCAGVMLVYSAGTITRCAFEANDNRALFISAAPGYVTDCTFSNTTGGYWTMTMNLGVVADCVFENSQQPCLDTIGPIEVSRCVFRDSTGGGALVSGTSAATFTNCLFGGNFASEGGAVRVEQQATPTFRNCTFAGNTAGTPTYGYGIRARDDSVVTLVNCVLWDDPTYELSTHSNGSFDISYSIVAGGFTGGTNIIDADPMFMDAAGGKFRLKYGSPCLDAGTMDGAPVVDYAGNPRPVDIVGVGTEGAGAIDMGAYEKQQFVWFVDKDNVSGTEDGESWATAFDTIQEGIDACEADGGGEVWVAEGAYTAATDPVVSMKETVDLYGGFQGTEGNRAERDWENRASAIDGEGTRQCVQGADGVILDGFTLTSGYAWDGGAMANVGVSPLVRNCTFSNNLAGGGGGAVYNSSGSPQFENCRFTENSVDTGKSGGAVAINGADTSFEACVFVRNSAPGGYGGAVHSADASPSFTDCALVENSSHWGGALELGGGSTGYVGTVTRCCFLRNSATWMGGGISTRGQAVINLASCVVIGNSAEHGAGFQFSSASLTESTIANCLVSSNSATTTGGGIRSGGELEIDNCTLQGNSSPQGSSVICASGTVSAVDSVFWSTAPFYVAAGSLNATYSDIQGGYAGTGNRSDDPQFVPGPSGTLDPISYDTTTYQSTVTDSSASFFPGALAGLVLTVGGTDYYYIVDNTATTVTVWGDVTQGGAVTAPVAYEVFNWHLSNLSPCIDQGDPTSTVTVDLDGELRPNGDDVDMGCDEFYNTPPVITTNGGANYRTGDATVTLDGTCESSSIQVRVNGSVDGVSYTSNQTTWSYTGTLTEGDNIFTVTTITAAGIESAPDTITVTYDPSEPQVESAEGRTATVMRVTFNEAMTDDAEFVDEANYTFDGAGCPLTAVSVARIDAATVDIAVNEMTAGAAYTVTVATDGPTDLTGNTMDPAANEGAFSGVGVAPQLAATAG